MLECKICHKRFKILTNTHLKKHGLTPKEYEELFGEKTVPAGWSQGENNPFFGKHHVEGKSKVKSKEYREAARLRRKGKKPQDFLKNIDCEEYSKKLSCSLSGKNNPRYGKSNSYKFRVLHSWRMWRKLNPRWRGIRCNNYPAEFDEILKERIREREGRRCFICGKSEEMNSRKLAVHHIDYDRNNCDEGNLVALCDTCHMSTSFGDRKKWIEFFSKTLSSDIGNQQPSQSGNILEGSEARERLLTGNAEESNSLHERGASRV